MARKTPKAVVKALNDHASMSAYWVNKTQNWNGEPLTNEMKEGVLIGLNIMIEAVLSAHGCYNGFRFVKYTETGTEWNSQPGYKLNRIEEQTREYFIKL